MKRYIQVSIVVFILVHLPVTAEKIRQLTWDNLVPANLLAEDPIAKLSRDQQEMVYWVIDMLESLPKKSPQNKEDYKELDAAMPTLKKAGIDIEKVMAKRKEIRTAIVEKLDGTRIRIPGYLLPLEVSDTKVTEFLLVPYVGACIHVPPPPPNQIIYVKTGPKNGYKSKDIFDPVWVTGTLSIKSRTKDLFLVDGSKGINIGYGMQADRIEAYEE